MHDSELIGDLIGGAVDLIGDIAEAVGAWLADKWPWRKR